MQIVDDYIATLPRWQQENLNGFRSLVHEVEPGIVEDWKWGSPAFILNGKILFTVSGFKAHTKYTFMAGSTELLDPKSLFTGGAKVMRHIDLREGEALD